MMCRSLCLLGFIAVLAGASCTGEPAATQHPCGVEVLGIELLAGGDLARLSYRVTDYDRARLTLRGQLAVLTADETHALPVLSAGRLGPLRQRPSRAGKKQFVLFTNAGRALEHGDTAVVVLGGARIPDVPVS